MSNFDRYINAFIQIEKKLKEIVNEDRYIKFRVLVEISSNKNLAVKLNYNKLLDFADLRNVLIHQRDKNNKPLAIPTDDTVNEIERLLSLISDNKKALYFASTPVKTITLNDSIDYVFNMMKSLNTTKIPVYENNRFINLLDMSDILENILNNKELKYVKEIIKENISEKVLFVDKNFSIDDVVDVFDVLNKKRKSIIIISENGNRNEIPLGVITIYDLPKIMSYLL